MVQTDRQAKAWKNKRVTSANAPEEDSDAVPPEHGPNVSSRVAMAVTAQA